MKRLSSISVRLSFYVILAVTVFVLAATTVATLGLRTVLKKDAIEKTSLVLNDLKGDVDNILSEVQTAADNMAWVVKENLDNPDYMYTITGRLVETNPYIIGSTVAFVPDFYKSKGYYYAPYSYRDRQTKKLISFQMGADDYVYFDMEWFAEPYKSGEPRWSEPYFDTGGGEQKMTTYSVPLTDAEGNVFAILTADLSLEGLSRTLKAVKPFPNSYTVLLGKEGGFIYHSALPEDTELTVFDVIAQTDSEALRAATQEKLSGKSGYVEMRDTDGNKGLMMYCPISNGWSLSITCHNSDIFARLTNSTVSMLFINFLCLIFIFIVARRIVKHQTRPVTDFTNAAQSIAGGAMDTPIPGVKYDDEFKILGDSLSSMVQSFKNYARELQESTAANERYESELNIASSIQQSMLRTDFPIYDNIDIYAFQQPAKEVGGDYYDYIVADGKAYFAVADVSGKGVPAALFMAVMRASFRSVLGLSTSIEDAVARVNKVFCDGNIHMMFATLFAGVIDLETLKMEFCNAGHNPIVVIDSDGKASYLKAKSNLAIGLYDTFEYEGESLQLSKGSSLILYTDGVTEAERADKEQYGEDKLLALAGDSLGDVSAREAVERIYDSVKQFVEGNEQNDDITILTLKI